MTQLRSAQSLEYLRIAVGEADIDGGIVDPTSAAVAFAFADEGVPIDDTTEFVAGTWETDASDPTNPTYYARVLVGPGGDYVPTAGTRIDVWISVTDNPEVPKLHSGSVRFL